MTQPYDPLTYRHPRTLEDTEDSRFRWFSSAEQAEAEERYLREHLMPYQGMRRSTLAAWCAVLIGLVAALVWLAR